MASPGWTEQKVYLERLRLEQRLYQGNVIPDKIPVDWPDDTYSGDATLTPKQADRLP